MGALLRLLVATESFPPRPHPLDPNLSLMIPASLPQLLLTRHSGSLERSGEWGWGEVGGVGKGVAGCVSFPKALGTLGTHRCSNRVETESQGDHERQVRVARSPPRLCSQTLSNLGHPCQYCPPPKKGHFPYRGLTGMCRVFNPAFGELSS